MLKENPNSDGEFLFVSILVVFNLSFDGWWLHNYMLKHSPGALSNLISWICKCKQSFAFLFGLPYLSSCPSHFLSFSVWWIINYQSRKYIYVCYSLLTHISSLCPFLSLSAFGKVLITLIILVQCHFTWFCPSTPLSLSPE